MSEDIWTFEDLLTLLRLRISMEYFIAINITTKQYQTLSKNVPRIRQYATQMWITERERERMGGRWSSDWNEPKKDKKRRERKREREKVFAI